MHPVSAKFVLCLLTDGQKENRVSIIQDMFTNADADADENFLTPADFFLFPTLKTNLKGHNFQDIEEIKENAMKQLRAIKQNAFQEASQKWKKRWQVEGTTLKRTVCKSDVSYLIKLLYS